MIAIYRPFPRIVRKLSVYQSMQYTVTLFETRCAMELLHNILEDGYIVVVYTTPPMRYWPKLPLQSLYSFSSQCICRECQLEVKQCVHYQTLCLSSPLGLTVSTHASLRLVCCLDLLPGYSVTVLHRQSFTASLQPQSCCSR